MMSPQDIILLVSFCLCSAAQEESQGATHLPSATVGAQRSSNLWKRPTYNDGPPPEPAQ